MAVVGSMLAGFVGLLAMTVAGASVALLWAPAAEPEDGPLAHLALACGWGFGVVPYAAFCLTLFVGGPMTSGWLLSVAALTTVAALALWRRAGGQVPVQLQRYWRRDAPVLVAVIAVGLAYLLKYDRSVFFVDSCLHRAVRHALHLVASPADLLRDNIEDQRLGNPAVLSGYVALFGAFGFRVVYALCGGFAALGGYLLGRQALGKPSWGWVVLVVLPLNPYVAKLPLIDENLMTMGFAALVLPLATRAQNVPWGHVGVLLGLCTMMRHTLILTLPAFAWAIWSQSGQRRRNSALRDALWFFTAFTAVTWVCHLHHYLAFGSLLRFESFAQFPHPYPHRLVGQWEGLLGWPFAPELIRTPGNPFPTFILWPLYLAAHLGVVLFAALVLGVVALWQVSPRQGAFWLLWLGPMAIALSVQENWDVPNKMGVIYMVFHPLALWTAAGLQAVRRSPRRAGVALLTLVLTSTGGMLALRGFQVPDDQRYFDYHRGERAEDPAYVTAQRDLLTAPKLWPDYARLGEMVAFFSPRKLAGIADDLADPNLAAPRVPYGFFAAEAAELAAPAVTLRLDLSARLWDRHTPWLTLAPPQASVDLDLTLPRPPTALHGLRLPWMSGPVTLFVTGGQARVPVLSLMQTNWQPGDSLASMQEFVRTLSLLHGWAPEVLNTLQPLVHPEPVLTLRVPAGPLGFAEVLNNSGQVYLVWQTQVQAQRTPVLAGPWRAIHN
ncbi:MAG: hypothetical protein EXR77_13520 [Myxococcales bacterium]|nr:hypothetical protein [Myxococcales bacterium]